MKKENLKIDKQVAKDLAYGDYDNTVYEIISNKIIGKSRWSYTNELIVKTLVDSRFWKSFYSLGATESQDESPYEYSEPVFEEVFPKTIEIVIYE